MIFHVPASRLSFTKLNSGGDDFEKLQVGHYPGWFGPGHYAGRTVPRYQEIQANEVVQRAQELSTQIEKLKLTGIASKNRWMNCVLNDEVTAGPQVSEIKEALEHARIEAGVSEVSGPGVEVTLNDSSVALKPGQNPNLYVLHDEDILRVLNELRAAGAKLSPLTDRDFGYHRSSLYRSDHSPE